MKRAYRIVRTRTILTELCVTADSLEELQESLNNGNYDDALDDAESEQWNVVDTNEDITDLTAQRQANAYFDTDYQTIEEFNKGEQESNGIRYIETIWD